MSVINVQTVKTTIALVTQFHRDLATCAMHGVRTAETVAKKTETLISAKYGETIPDFKAYKADMAGLKEVAKIRKLADAQWVLRPYWSALKKLYGSLPVSMAPDAVAKRVAKENDDKLLKAAKTAQVMQAQSNPVGAPAGQTQERQPSEAEQIEQLVARIGVWEALYACIRVLETDEKTAAQVIHMRKQADKLHAACDAADKAARVNAITPTAPNAIKKLAADLMAA